MKSKERKKKTRRQKRKGFCPEGVFCRDGHVTLLFLSMTFLGGFFLVQERKEAKKEWRYTKGEKKKSPVTKRAKQTAACGWPPRLQAPLGPEPQPQSKPEPELGSSDIPNTYLLYLLYLLYLFGSHLAPQTEKRFHHAVPDGVLSEAGFFLGLWIILSAKSGVQSIVSHQRRL